MLNRELSVWVPLRLDGEGSSGCCGSCGGFLSLPGLEDEVENDNGDDKTEGEDVDEQMPVHLGGLAVVQGAGQVSGSGETGGGLAHSRSSTGVPGRLPCSSTHADTAMNGLPAFIEQG